jgi:O-antigen/teichoic acid export membrane protein
MSDAGRRRGAAPDPADQGAERSLARTVGRAGVILTVRRVIVMVILAVTSIVVARYLGSDEFGAYASALGTAQLMLALSDLGFSLLLGRELAREPADRGALLRAATRAQSWWCLIPFAVLLGLAWSAGGPGDTRGAVMLIASPMVLAAGLGSARQVFTVLYQVRFLATVDLATNIVGSIAVMAAAVLTGSPELAALAFVASSVANTLIIARGGFRRVDAEPARPGQVRSVMRRSAPLGLASVLASAYFTIDLVILGWLVSGDDLGEYAVAVKFLSLLVAVPMLLAGVALPGLSSVADDRARLGRLAGRVAHWLTFAGLPLCAGAFVFAEPIATTVFGQEYAGAAPLIRILTVAGALSLVANVAGMLLVSLSLVRSQLVVNSVALVGNIAGNVALVPAYGVTASAWVTVATEVFVVACSLFVLTRHMPVGGLASAAWRPALASAALIAAGLPLQDVPLAGIPVAAAAFLLVIRALKAWPEEFRRTRSAEAGA